jgi:hypothetical protein
MSYGPRRLCPELGHLTRRRRFRGDLLSRDRKGLGEGKDQQEGRSPNGPAESARAPVSEAGSIPPRGRTRYHVPLLRSELRLSRRGSRGRLPRSLRPVSAGPGGAIVQALLRAVKSEEHLTQLCATRGTGQPHVLFPWAGHHSHRQDRLHLLAPPDDRPEHRQLAAEPSRSRVCKWFAAPISGP